ncbi:MAG: thioesterase [Caldithrix sp.]|nr:thioesterase [Caldithrix sp.]
MPRIKLDMPAHYIYETTTEVRITDLNYGNHLANDVLLGHIHEGRVRFLKHLDYSELDLAGTGIILGDVAIIYKAQAYYGDTLHIQIAVSDFARKSCDFYYRICNQDGKLVAQAKTAIVFFDYQHNKPSAVPRAFVEIIERLEPIV